MHNRLSLLGILVSTLLLPIRSGVTLTLDEFLDDGVSSSSTIGVASTSATVSTSALGGVRTLFAVKNSIGAGLTRIETFPDPEYFSDNDFSLGYTQGAHAGLGIVTWDGDSSAALLPNGLGALDLTQDGATALRLGLRFFDYPKARPLDITLKLYDGSNIIGSKYSELTVTLNQPINATPAAALTIPFSLLTAAGSAKISTPGYVDFPTLTVFGPSGAADLTKIGAIELIFNGLSNADAPDLSIDFLATNGRCSTVPLTKARVVDECGLCPDSRDFGKAKDQCGVCFGDGLSCLDCSGAPHGTAKLDACGTCAGNISDATLCQTSCKTVAATKEVLKFEKRLLSKARALIEKFDAEATRAAHNKCDIDTTKTSAEVDAAYALIRKRGREIFGAGIQVCGNSCVTVSYADQVLTLNPQFKLLERQTVKLANRVKNCFKNHGIPSGGGKNGVAATVRDVRSGVAELVRDCRDRKVCPPA